MACLPVHEREDELWPEEFDAIATAGPLRRRTFASGRACARAAMAEAGLPAVGLPRADDGAVVWPEGVTGSVSHTNDWAVAAVTVRAMSQAESVGVDLERIKPLEAGVLNLIATRAEQAELADTGNRHWHAVALFSIKESLYKCLRPSWGRFIGFHDVQLSDIAGGRPVVHFCTDALRTRYVSADVHLRMAVTPEHVFTLAWLREAD